MATHISTLLQMARVAPADHMMEKKLSYNRHSSLLPAPGILQSPKSTPPLSCLILCYDMYKDCKKVDCMILTEDANIRRGFTCYDRFTWAEVSAREKGSVASSTDQTMLAPVQSHFFLGSVAGLTSMYPPRP